MKMIIKNGILILAACVIAMILSVSIALEPSYADSNVDNYDIETMGLDKAAARFADSENVVKVAVIDSGIDKDHDWFQGRIDTEGSINLSDDKESDDYSDDSGHGTHVAGIIAKATPSNVKIMAIRIMRKVSEKEDFASIYDLIAAIDHAVASGADVINMSLGYDSAQLKYDLGGSYTLIDDALKRANDAGVTCFVASGNDGGDIANNYLAATRDTISVGSISDDPYTGKYSPSDFSNYGEELDFVAPGYYIESAIPGNTTGMKKGTSMACPHVAAAAAILKLAHPEHTKETIYKTFQKYSVDMEEEGWDAKTGHGYIDLSTYDGTKDILPGDDTGDEGTGEEAGGNNGNGGTGGDNSGGSSGENVIDTNSNNDETGGKNEPSNAGKKGGGPAVNTGGSGDDDSNDNGQPSDISVSGNNNAIPGILTPGRKSHTSDDLNTGKNNRTSTISPERRSKTTKVKKPKKVKLIKLKRKRKKIIVIWKKLRSVSGYQIRYRVKRNKRAKGKKSYKTVTIRKAGISRFVLRKLRGKKCYIVQVRAFRKYGGKTYFGKWSRRLRSRTK